MKLYLYNDKVPMKWCSYLKVALIIGAILSTLYFFSSVQILKWPHLIYMLAVIVLNISAAIGIIKMEWIGPVCLLCSTALSMLYSLIMLLLYIFYYNISYQAGAPLGQLLGYTIYFALNFIYFKKRQALFKGSPNYMLTHISNYEQPNNSVGSGNSVRSESDERVDYADKTDEYEFCSSVDLLALLRDECEKEKETEKVSKKKTAPLWLFVMVSFICACMAIGCVIGGRFAIKADRQSAALQMQIDSLVADLKQAERELDTYKEKSSNQAKTIFDQNFKIQDLENEYKDLKAKYYSETAYGYLLTTAGGIVYSQDKNYFHTPYCPVISPHTFSGTMYLSTSKDFMSNGYSPCSKCHTDFEIELILSLYYG